MEDQLRRILNEVGGLAVPAASIASDGDLFAAGLTSFATVSVMLAIEDCFEVEIPDELVNRATFRTIAKLAEVVMALQSGSVAA
jgi:acyl carrier protein